MEEVLEFPGRREKYHHFGYGGVSSSIDIVDSLRRQLAPFRFDIAAGAIINEIGITGRDKVLEIGCGVGLLGEAIKKKLEPHNPILYFGLDLNYDPELTSAKGRKLSPIQADATDLPFPDNSFDKIVSTDVFEHIDDPEKLGKEMCRVLKKGGRAFIVIADPSEGRFHFVKGHIKRTEGKTDVDFWEEMFGGCGFEIDIKSSKKYRRGDLRKVFDLPLLRKVKDKPFFSCAFRIVYRPGVYILTKPR